MESFKSFLITRKREKKLSLITIIIQSWIALLIVTFLHELGHMGKIVVKRIFPFPVMQCHKARYRYGGLIINGLTALLIMIIKPSSIFLQLIGLISLLYLVSYLIIGSFLPEGKPTGKNHVYDDIPNKKWPCALLAAVISLIVMGSYYVSVITKIVMIGGI